MSWLSNTLGSVAGSVLGSAVQNHYNSANAAQANAWNVENYKHRYQWAVEDMRQAGLNPVLAATNGIGGSISGASAASVGMSDIGSTMNSAKAASAAERQAKNAEHLAISQIDKNVAEADSVRQSTHGTVLQNGILANDLNLREQTYEKRLGYELEKMSLELENLRLQGSYLSSGTISLLLIVLILPPLLIIFKLKWQVWNVIFIRILKVLQALPDLLLVVLVLLSKML